MRQLTDNERMLLDRMRDIRSLNNVNWMSALENLMIYAPPEVTASIFDQINSHDLAVNKVLGELLKAINETV